MARYSGPGKKLSKPRRPPNYFSRRHQIRLLAAVMSLMLVLALMVEARKPENWEWMWIGQSPPDFAAAGQLDTRVGAAPRSPRIGTAAGGSPIGGQDVAARVRRHAWSAVLAELNRSTFRALDGGLRYCRTRGRAPPPDGGDLESARLELAQAWDQYISNAHSSLSDLPDAERLAWAAVLHATDRQWRDEWQLLLAALGQDRWSDEQLETAQELQRALDQFSWDQVEDDTVFRPAEHQAWFRTLEQLNAATSSELARRSLGPVSFVQLFRQPHEYRSKLVTVRGTVRKAYRVMAPRNHYEVPGYVVMWIKPAGGQLSPILVYCLELPSGFPLVGAKDAGGYDDDGSGDALSEEVEIDAYFFKRQAYRARDGINTAPVLLAKRPRWSPPPPRRGEPTYPSAALLGISFAATLFVAIGLAWLATR